MTSNEAIEDIDQTLAVIEDIEENYEKAWDNGEDFLVDVRDKLTSMRESLESRDEPTANQLNAIVNWGNGVRRWHPDYN